MPDRLRAVAGVDQAVYRLQQPYGVSPQRGVHRLIAAAGARRRRWPATPHGG